MLNKLNPTIAVVSFKPIDGIGPTPCIKCPDSDDIR